jgi:DNA modification methylase
VSGRARELFERGFYFLRYHPNGAKPSDVWDILPEDTQKRKSHFAPYPEDLCRIPLLATCPEGGVVLDPFAGTGTTNFVALRLGRKSVGIEVAQEYVRLAEDRCRVLL